MTIRSQTLYPDSVTDDEIVLPGKRKWIVRPEDALQIACVKLLRERGIPFIVAQPERLNAPPQRRDWFKRLGVLGNAGHPELIIFTPDFPLLVELKTDAGEMSPEQIVWKARVGLNGYRYYVVRSAAELLRLVAP